MHTHYRPLLYWVSFAVTLLPAPLLAQFTLTDLGPVNPFSTTSVNDFGQVVGTTDRAFLYSGGTNIDLGTLGGTWSYGIGINNFGQTTGESYTSGNTAQHAFLYSGGVMSDLGTFGGTDSVGTSINDSGQVTGRAKTTGNAAAHTFLYSGGTMTDLGTLGGTNSSGNGINNAGQVTGSANVIGGHAHAFLYSDGTMTDLGTLGGTTSTGRGINDSGQVAGSSTSAGGSSHAFLYSEGTMYDLNTMLLDPGEWNLNTAYDINNAGQIVASGLDASNGSTHALLLTPELHYRSTASGNWDTPANWTLGLNPAQVHDVFVDPTTGATVYGPANAVTVNTLTIDGRGPNAANLQLQSAGVITATNGVTLGANGILRGAGEIAGAFDGQFGSRIELTGDMALGDRTGGGSFNSDGTILLNGHTLTAESQGGTYLGHWSDVDLGGGRLTGNGWNFYNDGRIFGGGAVESAYYFQNQADGRIEVASEERLHLASHVNNYGSISVREGELEVRESLYNGADTGSISARDAALHFQGGLNNEGGVGFTFGTAMSLATSTTWTWAGSP